MLFAYFGYILLGALLALYLYSKWAFSYWRRQGLEYLDPKMREPLQDKIINGYNYVKSKGSKHGGIFLLFKPVYVPVDLDLVKNILQNDFSHFVNRSVFSKPPTLLNNLLHMEDDEWRNIRSKLTPTFSSGKMKMMFQNMLEKCKTMKEVLNEHAVINESVDMRDTILRFTTDVIGTTIFGIECNCLKTPNSEFRNFGNAIVSNPRGLQLALFLPKPLIRLLRIKIIPDELESYFLNLIKSTIDYREQNNIHRKDFMNLLLELKHNGIISSKDHEKVEFKNDGVEHLSLPEIAAQCLIFFLAGYETSATTMSFAVFEMSQNQDMQEKLRQDIRKILNETGGILTYDAVMKMEYLDKVVNETLRKYPPIQSIPRTCNKEYHVPGTNYVIKKGQLLMMPYRAIHHDPEYWPNPGKFDPERFSPEVKATRHKFAFLPFGEGPRNCIGARFGLLQTKTGLASIFKDFKVTLCDDAPLPLEFKSSGILSMKDGYRFNIEKVN